MFRASVAGLLTLLAATSFAAEPNPAPTPATAGVTILDERAAADKKRKLLSMGITSCEYGVYRLDEKRAPGRFDALSIALESSKGVALAGKTLHVARYDVYFSNGARLRDMTYRAHTGGVVTGAMIGLGANCPREKMKGGWFAASEVTTPHGPIIVEMTVSLDGATYESRSVHSSSIEMMGGFKSPEEKAEMSAALKSAADALAAKLP